MGSRGERKFQEDLIAELKRLFPGSHIIENDPQRLQGIPDLLILFGEKWGMLECKISENATRQPNQEYYVDKFGKMSFAAFIHPGNKDQVLHDLQLALRADRKTCVPKR